MLICTARRTLAARAACSSVRVFSTAPGWVTLPRSKRTQ